MTARSNPADEGAPVNAAASHTGDSAMMIRGRAPGVGQSGGGPTPRIAACLEIFNHSRFQSEDVDEMRRCVKFAEVKRYWYQGT